MVVGSIVTVAAVAVAWQVILPQVSTSFQILGDKADAGTYLTKGGAKNAILLGAILVVFTTIVNMIGVKLMARINNVGVILELIGATLLIVLLTFHFSRGPGVVFNTLGLGEGHQWGYFGAFIIGGIMSAYVMYGFDTAGTLAEETNDPRRNAPPAIIKALATASLIGGLMILFALMAVDDIHDKNIAAAGPALHRQAGAGQHRRQHLPHRLGHRDHRVLPGGAHVVHPHDVRHGARRPAARSARRWRGCRAAARCRSSRRIVVGILAIVLLAINIGNQSAFLALTSVAIIMFYLAYLCVTGPLLLRRIRGTWPTPEHGTYFSLGRWGMLVNVFAVVYGAIVAFNIAWPRNGRLQRDRRRTTGTSSGPPTCSSAA